MAQLLKGKQIAQQTVTIKGATGNVVVQGDLDMSTYNVIISGSPTADNQAVNKAYVDAVAGGLVPHLPVHAVATGTTVLTGTTTIDDFLLSVDDRVLLTNQGGAGATDQNPSNGVWQVKAGAWIRPFDFDGTPTNEVSTGDFVFVENGTVNGKTGWVLATTDAVPETEIVVNVDTQGWVKISSPGTYSTDGEGLDLTGTVFSLELDGGTLSKTSSGVRVASSVITQISNNQGNVTSLSTALSSEISSNNSSDTSLSTAISTEASTRGTADTSLSTAISGNASATTSLSTAVSTETSTRGSADTSLATAISGNTSAATSLSTAVSTEASTRGTADTSLSTAISTETSTRGTADTSLSTAVSTETSTRGSADTSLSTAISANNSSDTSLSTALSSETSTRGSADTSLSTAISTEASTRGSADTSITTAISGEASIRSSADTSLSTQIASLTSGSTAGVDSLSTALSGEISSRGSADTSLATGISTAVSTEASTRGTADTSLSTAISTEASTRGSADTSLATGISTAVSTEASTRGTADTSLETAISNIQAPSYFEQLLSPAISGSTTAVNIGTAFAHGVTGGVIDESTVIVFLNGIEYTFEYAQGSPAVFHTNGVTPTSAGTPLYFDGVEAGFAIETTDDVKIKYVVTT
jgi:hypothetical protein